MIDDHSRYTVVKLLKHKSQVTSAIKEIITEWTTEFGQRPKVLRTDNGTEYVNDQLTNFLKQQGIKHQTTVAHTPQQNGVAERKNRSLQEMAKCMLLDSNLPNRFWGEAMITAAYLQNRLPSRSIEKTPMELWNGKRPDVSHIRIFGSKCFTYIPKRLRQKWDDKVEEGVLIGYSDTTKGYKVLDINSNKVRVSRTVKIIEPAPKTKLEVSYLPVAEGEHSDDEDEHDSSHDTPVITPQKIVEAPSQEVIPERQLRVSQRVTKGKIPKRFCSDEQCLNVQQVPISMEDVLRLPTNERQKWIQAAAQEMKTMEKLQVWKLVDLPPDKKAITVKWIFRIKANPENYLDTYKARLVARGFSQFHMQDYDETFAPVVRHDTVRTLLTVATTNNLHVRHLDVESAYLNSILKEEIYIIQPPGFEIQGQEDKVYRLYKSLYGLKQSARTWNKMATDALSKLNFQQGKADQCLFTRLEKNGHRTYVLLYVDDLLVAADTAQITEKVGMQLNKFFHTKDLGDVKNYLGIQLERASDGSFLLHQRNKIELMLEQHGLLDCKTAATPMETDFLSTNEQSRICGRVTCMPRRYAIATAH
uniref:Integrase catalytic domain-containing protein n=1 Tax=Trichuris muris TaxID=70415 RepID=A0A5S6Q5K7_TRIMR